MRLRRRLSFQPAMAKAHYGLSLAYQELGMESQLNGGVPDPGKTGQDAREEVGPDVSATQFFLPPDPWLPVTTDYTD